MLISNANKKILLLTALLAIFSGCSGKRYTSNDGISIFSQSTNIDISPNLIYVDVEPQQVNIDECMLTNDFDPQKAHLSMLSYPDIDEGQYDSKFKRTGKLDFYLHPIMCDGKVFDITNTAKIIEYNLNNGKMAKITGGKSMSKMSAILELTLDDNTLAFQSIIPDFASTFKILPFDKPAIILS